MTDLRIRKELLDSLVLPIAIKMGTTRNIFCPFLRSNFLLTALLTDRFIHSYSFINIGYVGKLRIEVPWTRLWSGELKVRMDDVLVILGPVHKDNFDSDAEHARLTRVKQKTILGAELYQQAIEETADEIERTKLHEADVPIPDPDPMNPHESRVEGLISSIVRNCLIEINRVHVRYEDGESAPERSLALGLTLSCLSVRSSATDEVYTTVFQDFASKLTREIAKFVEERDRQEADDPTPPAQHQFAKLVSSNLSTIFKTVRLDSLGVYFNSRDVLFLPKRTTQEQLTVQQSMPDTIMSAPVPIKLDSETTPSDVEGSEKLTKDGTKPIVAPYVSESSIERIIRNMVSMIAKHDDDESRRRNGLQYLIKPFNVDVMVKTHARIAKQPVYDEPNFTFVVTLQGTRTDPKSEKLEILNSGDLSKTMDLPTQSSDSQPVKLPSIQIEVDQDQLAAFGMMSATLGALAVKRKFAQFRPRVSARENPRAWWLFLRETLFHDIQKERKKRSLAYIDERRRVRMRYVALYREKILRTWGFDYDPILKSSSLDTSEHQDIQPSLAEMRLKQPFTNSSTFLDYQLNSLEERIDADDIIFFRACARAQIESEGLVKPANVTPTAYSHAPPTRSLWSRLAPWFGGSGNAADHATKANSDPTRLRNALSKYHFSRLESSEPLQHDEPWVAKLRLAIESSDPNAAWSSSLHSEHAHRIAPKYRHVHPDYAQTAGHISLPSIQLTLLRLEDPVIQQVGEKKNEAAFPHDAPKPTSKEAAPVSTQPPSFTPSQYTLMGPQFTITHTERKPLGRLELLGIQVGLEIKPTHRSTSLRLALASISFADLTSKALGGAQLVRFNPEPQAPADDDNDQEPVTPNLLDVAIELNPYHTKTGCRFTFDTFIAAKLRRLILLPNLDFFALLSKNFSKSTSNSFENVMNASKTLEKLKKVTRRHTAPTRPTRSAPANALLINACIDLPLVALTTHSTHAFDENSTLPPVLQAKPSAAAVSGASPSSTTPVVVADLGTISVKSTLSFPHEPSLTHPQTPYGAVPLHFRERWVNSLLISWEGLSATIGEIPFKSDKGEKTPFNVAAAISSSVNSLLSTFPSNYSLEQLSKLNRLHSCFRYCNRQTSSEAAKDYLGSTRFLILPMMPTRAVIKITSNPLLFVKEANIALKEGHLPLPPPDTTTSTSKVPKANDPTALASAASSDASIHEISPTSGTDTEEEALLQQLASSISQSKGLAKTEINACIARISLQVDPATVSSLLRLINDIKPSKVASTRQKQTVIATDTKATPLVVNDGVQKFPIRAHPRPKDQGSDLGFTDELVDELIAHQVAPNVQSFMFGSSSNLYAARTRRVGTSEIGASSDSISSTTPYASDSEYDDARDSDFDEDMASPSSSHYVPQIVVSPLDNPSPPKEKLDSASKQVENLNKKVREERRKTRLRKWIAANVSIKLLSRGLSVLVFARSPQNDKDSPHSSLGISLLDARVKISAQADLKNEIKASIGSLLVYHPHLTPGNNEFSSATPSYPFAAAVPEGHFYASGWERKWVNGRMAAQQPKRRRSKPKGNQSDADDGNEGDSNIFSSNPFSTERDWLSACFKDDRQVVSDVGSQTIVEEGQVRLSRSVAPLLSFGACVYGLPSSMFFDDGPSDPHAAKEVNNRSFWKRSTFCASHESYNSEGNERLVSVSIDVDNDDAIRPITSVKAHLGPLVLCPSIASLAPVLTDTITPYLDALKSTTSSSPSSSKSEKSELDAPDIPKVKIRDPQFHTWLETSPAVHVAATWSGLAVVVPKSDMASSNRSSAPLLVLSVSRFRMSMDSVAKNKDMQLMASVGSLDLEIDEKDAKVPNRVFPFPLPRSIISVRSYMQPKSTGKYPFIKTSGTRQSRSDSASASQNAPSAPTSSGSGKSGVFSSESTSRSYFLALRLVSRAHSVKEAHRHRHASTAPNAANLVADAVKLQQEAQEAAESSNLAREGPWQRKISAKLSRLSIVVSPTLAWTLLEKFSEAMPFVDRIKQALPKKDDKTKSKSEKKASAFPSTEAPTPDQAKEKHLFSVPKLNIRLELPELLVPLSDASPFEHVSSTQPVHPSLRNGVGRGLLLTLGTINATDGYSSGETHFDAPDTSLASSTSSASPNKPEGKSFDLHYMATWKGINACLSYTVFEVEHNKTSILRRITPLSLIESPYAMDYCLMDSIVIQQTPIIVHVAQKNVYYSGPRSVEIPALHDDDLPEFVLNSIKMRVELRVGQLRVRISDHVVQAFSAIFEERIDGYIASLKKKAKILVPVEPPVPEEIQSILGDPVIPSNNDSRSGQKISSRSSAASSSTAAQAPKKQSKPLFLSARILLVSVELFQSVYDASQAAGPSSAPSSPLSAATSSFTPFNHHLYAHLKDVVASWNTPTNPRPCAIVKIGSVAIADVAAIFCNFADQHDAQSRHTLIDVHVGAINVLLAAHRSMSDSVCKSIVSVQSKYITHCMARASRIPVPLESVLGSQKTSTLPTSSKGQNSAKTSEALFNDAEALYNSVSNLSSLVAWSSYTVPGQFNGYIPETSGIGGTSFLEKAVVLSPPMVQLLGQRSLIYSHESSHESPSYPLIKIHFLTTDTVTAPHSKETDSSSESSSTEKRNGADVPNTMDDDLDPIIDPSIASSSLAWVHPNIAKSGSYADDSSSHGSLDDSLDDPSTAAMELSFHSEKQITIEADHLLAVANFESLAYLLQYIDQSLVPNIPKVQSSTKTADASISSDSSSKKDKATPSASSTTAAHGNKSSHTRILARLSLLSVQIPATSRLPIESSSKLDAKLSSSRSDPPRSVVPSVVLEFGVDAEVSLLDVDKQGLHSNRQGEPKKSKKKPSIKSAVLLHSLQLYRTAYGQSTAAAGASSVISREGTLLKNPAVVAAATFLQPSGKTLGMDAMLKSPILQTVPPKDSHHTTPPTKPASSSTTQRKNDSTYSLSFADIGKLFTDSGANGTSRSTHGPTADVRREWPSSAPGAFGWRSTQPQPLGFASPLLGGLAASADAANNGGAHSSQPHLSRLSKVPLLDPVSISASATILPGGSMDVSVLAEPLFLKVSNRDALAFLAILKSILGSPLLHTANALKSNITNKFSSHSPAPTAKKDKKPKSPDSSSAASSPSNVSVKSSFFQVSLAGMHLLVLEDNAKGSVGVGAETPIVNVQLQSILAEIQMSSKLYEDPIEGATKAYYASKLRWKDEICAVVSMELKASYFDARGAFWETLIDPWRLDLHVEKVDMVEVERLVGDENHDPNTLPRLPRSKQLYKVLNAISSDIEAWIRADERIELTITSEFLKILQKAKLRWNLSEWRLALESYSPYTKDAHAGAQRSLDFDARKTRRRNSSVSNTDLSSDLDSQSQVSSSAASNARFPFSSLLSKPMSSATGTLTPHSLLSSALGRDRNIGAISLPRTPAGLAEGGLSVTPAQQVVLVNKTGLPLSFSLASAAASVSARLAGLSEKPGFEHHQNVVSASVPSQLSKNLGFGAHSQVLSIDSQTTLDLDDITTLSLQFGTYNIVHGIPIFEAGPSTNALASSSVHLGLNGDGNSSATLQGHSSYSSATTTPITGVRFFQITRSLTRESESASSMPSGSMDGENKNASFSQSHILVVEYSTIDLSTFITVRGTATIVNDCRSKNVRVGHAKLKSIHEHHLLPAGSSWPIPFQWLDEGILNDLLHAHHLSQIEKKLAKKGKRLSSWESEVTPPPPSKSQLTIDFQTLTPPMLMSMFTSKGSSGTASGASTPPLSVRRRSDSSASSHHRDSTSTILPPPFSLSVHYQTSNNDDSNTSGPHHQNKGANGAETVGIGSRQMEEMARLLPDFGASSLPLSIHIRPSLVLENLLPVPVDVRILDRETAKLVVQENGVPTSKAVEVFCDAMSHPLLLSIRVPPSTHWSDDYLINTNAASRSWNGERVTNFGLSASLSRPDSPPTLGPRTLIHANSDESNDENLADSILVRDDFDPSKPLSLSSIAKTHVLLDYKRPQLFTLHLSLYAAFWIENKSALPLSFAFTDQADLATKTSKGEGYLDDADEDEEKTTLSTDGTSSDSGHSTAPSASPINTSQGNSSSANAKDGNHSTSKFAPSPSALLPFQIGHKHLGGLDNFYPSNLAAHESEVSTVIDNSLVRPLFASFVSPASQKTGLALFVHWIRRPPHKPLKSDPRTIQEDLEGRNRHWSEGIDLSAFLPASLLLRKPDANSLAAPIHICLPYSPNLFIHLAVTIERCTGVFYKSFKISVAPRLFVANVSSPGIESTFWFSSSADSAGSTLTHATSSHTPLLQHSPSSSSSLASTSSANSAVSQVMTLGDPEREIQVTISSPADGTSSTAIPVYLLPTRDIRFDDLQVHARLRSTSTGDLESDLAASSVLQTTSITLNSPQSHLVNLTADGVVRGMSRLEVARVETSAFSGTLSSYLLAVSTSSQFFVPSTSLSSSSSLAAPAWNDMTNGGVNDSSPSRSSIAFQLCPYWINNSTQYWIKVTQSINKKSKKIEGPNSSLHIAPGSSAPFTWDQPEGLHGVDIFIWTAVSSSPPETLGLSTSHELHSNWLLLHKSVELDSTLLQLPLVLDGLSETGGKARVKNISLSNVASQVKSLGTWNLSSKKAVVGVEVLVEGPRRHLNILNLSEKDFFCLEQITSQSVVNPSSDRSQSKLKPNINVKAFLGGLGVSIIHSKKRVLNAYQPHKLYTTTSAVEDSAELLYLAVADISADANISAAKGTALTVKIEAIQLDCPDHAKLNTPNAVILTTMLDDVADSNTGTTDESGAEEAKECSALALDLRLPPTPSSSGFTLASSSTLGSNLKKTASPAHSLANSDPNSFTRIDYLSLQLRPITICLDQSFVEILLNFANDSFVPSSASSAANASRAAKYKKTGIPANVSSQFAAGYIGGLALSSSPVARGVHLDASQLTYGITSAVADINPKSILSSATLAMASTDATRILSSGLAFHKKPMFIGELIIRPLTLRLTLTTSASISGTHRQTGYDSTRSSLFDTLNVNRIIRAIGVGTVGVDGLKLRFGSNGVSRALVSPKELSRMVMKTYLPRAVIQTLKVFGTLNFTGSPLILVENLAEGMMDILVDPLHTQSGHGGYFSGAVYGAQNLVIKSIFGLSTSASNASASAAKLLSVLVDSSSSSSSYSPYQASASSSSSSRLPAQDRYRAHSEAGNTPSSSRRNSISSTSELVHGDQFDTHSNYGDKIDWNSIWDEDDDCDDHLAETEDMSVSSSPLSSIAARPDITYSSSSSIISAALGGYTSTSNGSTGTSTSSESLLANSFLTLGKSIVGGATGLITHPIRGWRTNGARGAIRGLARGVANLALKPSLAVAQILQGTADHLRMPAQRPPPSLIRAPRIPKLAISMTPSGHTQAATLTSSMIEDSYSTSLWSVMGYSNTMSTSSASSSAGPSHLDSPLSSSTDGSFASTSGNNGQLASSSSSSFSLPSNSAPSSSNAAEANPQTVTASVLTYLLASSTTSPSRHWDCYDGKSSIGYWLLSKVSREKYNSEFSYRSRYGHVSPLGSYVNHWFMASEGSNHGDSYYILTTRCFIKVVPSSSGVPFDASKNRIRQISLLSLSPLDIRYVILLSDVAAASFERPAAIGLPPSSLMASSRASPQNHLAALNLPSSSLSQYGSPKGIPSVRVLDPTDHRSPRSSLDNSHFVYILLTRPYAASIDSNGTEFTQIAEEDDEIPKKWFRKVKLASEFEAAQLLQLLPSSAHLSLGPQSTR